MARDLALTLAGGGNRALVQIGLLRRWWPLLEPRIAAISTVSAGSSMAVSLLTGREREATAYWLGRRAGVTRNVHWRRLLRGERPTPHTPIYRDTLRYERQIRYGRLHPSLGRRLGFRPNVHDLRACTDPEEVVELVLASSATPPFTPIGRHGGRPLLDGGLVDNAPAFVAEDTPGVRRHLVLLTRLYPEGSVGHKGNRWYLCPSGPVPISRWEYTRPDLIEATIALGDRDATLHHSSLREFLDAD